MVLFVELALVAEAELETAELEAVGERVEEVMVLVASAVVRVVANDEAVDSVSVDVVTLPSSWRGNGCAIWATAV